MTSIPLARGTLGLLLFLPTACQSAAPPAPDVFSEADFDQAARQVVPRDSFPVLDAPTLYPLDENATELRADEPVIGVFLGGEARAYPVSVMGNHELVNDFCGGTPIAVSW